MSVTNKTVIVPTTTTASTSSITGLPYATSNTISISSFTVPNDWIKIGEIESHTITTGNGSMIIEYNYTPKIVDINVYGHDKPKVVEVEFKYQHDTVKIKSICCDEDEFDLKKGVYIAMSKLLYGDEYTTEGIEEKAHELSLKKSNEKMVDKAIRDYHRKIKTKEENDKKEKEEKLAKLKRKEKNRARRQKKRERSLEDLAELIKKATN